MTAADVASLCQTHGLAAAAIMAPTTTREEMQAMISEALSLALDLLEVRTPGRFRRELTIALVRELRGLQIVSSR